MPCSMHNLSAMLSSPPADLSLYHHTAYPTVMYSTCARVNSRDVLLRFVFVIWKGT